MNAEGRTDRTHRWRFAVAAAALVLGVVVPAAASAQLSEGGGPVSYSADTLEYFDAENRLVLRGDVDIVQGDARLRADSVTLFFAESAQPASEAPAGGQPAYGAGDIERMVADGDVFFVRPDQHARGNRAVYEPGQDRMIFSGNVVVASADNIIRGETMTLQISTRRTVIRPAAGERVRGVLTQSSSSEEEAAPSEN